MYRHLITGRFVDREFAQGHPEMVVMARASGSQQDKVAAPTGAAGFDVRLDPSLSTLFLSDRVTVRYAQPLLEAARRIAAEPVDAVIDCSDVTYLDTAAVQVLAALRNEFENSSTSMRIEGVSEEMKRSLEIAGLWNKVAG